MNAMHLKVTLTLVFSLMIGTVFMHELHVVPWPGLLGSVDAQDKQHGVSGRDELR